jgi:hypothetical protein
MPTITLAGEKYQYLEVGETIEKGDILIPSDDDECTPGYLTVWDELVGTDYCENMEPIVRKIM